MKKRTSQHENETAIEYLRRVVSSLNHEFEAILDELPDVNAVLDYFDLMHSYDTEYWNGIFESIMQGKSPALARKFIRKYKLPDRFNQSINEALQHKD